MFALMFRGCAAIAVVSLSMPVCAGVVQPPLVEHQPLTIDYAGPLSGEFASPNPFLDYRLQVTFTGPSSQTYVVPGYFAGNGSGGAEGNTWRVKFAPDEPGDWQASASFRMGTNVAVAVLADETPDPSAGASTSFDGTIDNFTVAARDENAPGYLKYGRLGYDGTHYLKFEDGPYYVKGGVDSPENWLGYVGFDNTIDFGAGPSTASGLHEYATHVSDWQTGDPDWDSPDTANANDGRAIIGALNYLHSVGANSMYFLPMNIGGDGKDTWPYASTSINGNGSSSNDNTRFDISKLEQWDMVFSHAQEKGILLHFVLAEAEKNNKRELDDAALGTERRLFYREMIARFGYHPAIVWNISEEYNHLFALSPSTVLQFAQAVKGQDPYDRPVTVHSFGDLDDVNSNPWTPFFGEQDIDLTSLQYAKQISGWSDIVEDFRAASVNAGKPIPVMVDEPGSPTRDLNDDGNYNEFRKRVIWDILLSGGGAEWFVHDRDQAMENFREYHDLWVFTKHAREFVETLPFWEMEPADELVSGESNTWGGAEVFTKPGHVYAVYFPNATTTGTIDLSGVTGTVERSWYNPRTGLQQGTVDVIDSGASVAVGAPPAAASEDWAVTFVATTPSDPADPVDPVDPLDPQDCNSNELEDAQEIAALTAGGLRGAYFDGAEFTGETRSRIDEGVDFDWGSGAPFPDWNGNTFTCRWTGYITAPESGTYTFGTRTNDGARLWVNGIQLVDQWVDQAPTTHTGTIALEAGKIYAVRMEHYEGQGTAVAELLWQVPSANSLTNIAASVLTPVRDANANSVIDSCETCVDDINADGERDFFDVAAFCVFAERNEPITDRNTDGVLAEADISAFLQDLQEGCE